MTTEELDAIESRCNAATPGDWYFADLDKTGLEMLVANIDDEDVSILSSPYLGCDQIDANWDFIAAARTAIPALVAEVRRLREGLEVIGIHALVLAAGE